MGLSDDSTDSDNFSLCINNSPLNNSPLNNYLLTNYYLTNSYLNLCFVFQLVNFEPNAKNYSYDHQIYSFVIC